LWSGGKKDANCANCGKEIEVSKWRLEQSDGNVFCDSDCHAEHRSDGDRPHQPYYGKNWEKKREERIVIDDEKCRVCGITRQEHYDEHGIDLSVHHIVRFLDFDKANEANQLSNLVTLCSECHRNVESGKIELGDGVKPSLDDWPSSTAADDDAVVLAEQLGLPYDEKAVVDDSE
jgi:5-methylcytosine-specific restriction endonuclease McrA